MVAVLANVPEVCGLDLWVCPRADRAVASQELITPSFTRTDAEYVQPESHRHVGYLSLLQDPANTRRPLPKNPTVPGVSTEPWLMQLFAGSPPLVTVDVVQLPRGQLVVLVIPYPAGTAFSIPATQKWYGPRVFPVSAASADAVLSM